ncbi:MAG: OFA family MFS transporter [Oscillospiraceae bacterium]|nr:OFA family MFS transporter [Oscillospiraceae bacterium]
MKKTPSRYLILAAAAISGLMVGIALTWSIFKNPLMEKNQWSSNTVTLTYSLYMLFACFGTLLCPVLQKKIKPHLLVLTGGVMHGMGLFFTGYANAVWQMYLSYSVMAGLANGFIYNTAISAATKWFPDKKGFANGICVGCMGLASLIFAPLGNFLIANFDISTAFRILGLLMTGIFLAVSWFIAIPEEGWKPAGMTTATAVTATSSRDLHWKEMLKTPAFYTMWLMTLCAVTAGSMMTGQASAMAQQMANITAAQASTLVAIMAVANFSGRLGFGFVSDKFGRYPVLFLLMCVSGLDMLLLFPNANNYLLFTVALCIAAACYGGTMAMLPSLVSDAFGTRYFSTNYACIYTGFTCASFVGPMAASNVLQNTGSYQRAFLIAGGLALCGIVLSVITKKGLARDRIRAA